MKAESYVTQDELVDALDSDGKPLPHPVSRSYAHRHGIWHRSISVFVLNRYGEALIERRSKNKDLFPGFYDIVGGHVHPEQTPLETACREVYEELNLKVSRKRFELLAPVDSVIERVVLPDQSIVNLERKTIYLLRLTLDEESAVARLAAELLRLTPEELEERGTSGEVSQLELWPWERLFDASRLSQNHRMASGTLSALSDDRVREQVAVCCLSLRNDRREEFVEHYAFLKEGNGDDDGFDQSLFDRFLPRPTSPAPIEEVNAVFKNGPEQLAGAYELGRFSQTASGDDHWGPKLRDPETRYVRSLLTAIGCGRKAGVRQELDRISTQVQSFVSDLLNLPLSDGNRFRDKLGNLAHIAAARRAVLVWLEHAAPDLAKTESLDRPTGLVTEACLQAGNDILRRFLRSNRLPDLGRFRELVLVGLRASSADFNNPPFQKHLKAPPPDSPQIERFLEQKIPQEFAPEMGGDQFLSQFYSKFVESGESVTIAYLAGNAAQASISLAIAQEILSINGNAKIRFVPKSDSPGNDLTFADAERILAAGEHGIFSELIRFRNEGRFAVEQDGPLCHGLDPRRLSASISKVLVDAQVILAEGQAYAEICGWKKPTYISFRVNGRVAEAIHGISRQRGVCGFVGLTPGVDHFQNFESAICRSIVDAGDKRTLRVAAQTTAEYVRAIRGENLDLIVNHLFQGNLVEACEHVQAEADRLGKSFAQILIGAASEPPDATNVAQLFRNVRFPVFACGGGGGFSSVTLRALRMLGLPTVAGVPSTDDGGSTGELQRWLASERGFVFGMGDMAAIMQDALPNRGKQAVLAYRFDSEPKSLALATIMRIVAEIASPTYPDSPIGSADDFLSFVCGQLNLARVVDGSFRGADSLSKLPIKGASIRNLNIIAAYELCDLLGDRGTVSEESRLAAFYMLQEALGLPPDLLVVPVTYSESVLYLEYENPIQKELAEEFDVPDKAIGNNQRRLYGQQFIDKLPQSGSRSTVGVAKSPSNLHRPRANPEYLSRLQDAELFVMGAGSLIGSQLSQLAIPGVVDVLLERSSMRRILVLNHVKMDETLGMSLRDQIRLIETVASETASRHLFDRWAETDGRLRISDLFTDIVVPRTIARELEAEMKAEKVSKEVTENGDPNYVFFPTPGTNQTIRVFCNRYVKFLLDHPNIGEEYGITKREIEVLSYLDQPSTLYNRRSEGGRYRGALFATTGDIDFLVDRGIQRRSIHEVDSIGENWKIVKAEGAPRLEFFPGLVPEALVGIFRIALERASSTSTPTR
ncbi:MAG: NUDIX domain-containing protein [candidate division Zixibacteria bacterium]|nr:NUDIX domain-containing protein [candidate division Zixibacteria bacterium]